MTPEADGFRDRMACLADESRFRIVLALAAAEQCVSDLARSVGLSQSCTTRHLQALARRGLVRGDRRGRQVVFALQLDAPEIRVVLQAFDPEAADLEVVAAMPARSVTPQPILDLDHHEVSDRIEADEPEPRPPTPIRTSDLEDYLL